jgi:hypothetical protein
LEDLEVGLEAGSAGGVGTRDRKCAQHADGW